MKSADYWVKKLGLQRHPEGGYFREIYRSGETVPSNALPERYNSERPFSTSIYFLLRGDEVSLLHRLKSDELWHFYLGSPLTIHVIDSSGNHLTIKLSNNPENGEALQAIVKKGCWFGIVVNDTDSFALAGCTVSPGFEFEDLELGRRKELIRLYPQHRLIIERLTK